MYLEVELVAALEEIENLKELYNKQEHRHQIEKNLLGKKLTTTLQKKEEEIKSLKDNIQKSSVLSQKFQKSSSDLNNIFLHQRKFGDTSGLGYSSESRKSKP